MLTSGMKSILNLVINQLLTGIHVDGAAGWVFAGRETDGYGFFCVDLGRGVL